MPHEQKSKHKALQTRGFFYCASHAHIKESLSVVSLGDAVRLRLPLGRHCRATGSRLKGNAHELSACKIVSR